MTSGGHNFNDFLASQLIQCRKFSHIALTWLKSGCIIETGSINTQVVATTQLANEHCDACKCDHRCAIVH